MNPHDEMRALTCHCGRIACRHHEGDTVNTTTRELIERELEQEQGRFDAWNENIDHLRDKTKRLERERDEIVDRIGALKEDLGHKDVATTLRIKADGFQRAMRAYQDRLEKLYGRETPRL